MRMRPGRERPGFHLLDGDDEGVTQPTLVLDLTLHIRLVALDLHDRTRIFSLQAGIAFDHS